MKISVIVPMYKVEKYLKQCLDSIVNQTYKNLEIILVDDGSPDKCGQIAEEYAKNDNRIRVIHQENKGLCAARNVGLEVATGDYVAFVDSDDYLSLNMYEEMINEIDKDLDVISSCQWYRDIDGTIVKEGSYDSGILENEAIINALCTVLAGKQAYTHLTESKRIMISGAPWDKLYRKDFLKKNNLLFDEELKALEDVWFNYNVIKNTKRVKGLKESYYYYRLNNQSITVGFKPNRIKLSDDFSSRLVKDIGVCYFTRPDSSLVQSAYDRIFGLIVVDVRCFLCHKENKDKFWKKRKQLIEHVEGNKIYKQAIMAINPKALSPRQKLFLHLLRRHMYTIVLLAGSVRNNQRIFK